MSEMGKCEPTHRRPPTEAAGRAMGPTKIFQNAFNSLYAPVRAKRKRGS